MAFFIDFCKRDILRCAKGFVMTPCIPVDYTNKIKRTHKNKRVHIDTSRYRIVGELSAADKLKIQIIAGQSKTL